MKLLKSLFDAAIGFFGFFKNIFGTRGQRIRKKAQKESDAFIKDAHDIMRDK